MSISGISSSSNIYQAAPSTLTQRKQDFQALGTALQSGDLASAQQTFAQLQKDGIGQTQSSSSTGQSSSQNSPFQTLADALQKGDLLAPSRLFHRSSKT